MGYLIHALIAGSATVLGGLLPLYTDIGKTLIRYLLGFAAGAMISTALVAMLPAAAMPGDALLPGVGFFLLYLIEKGVRIHACGERECEVHSVDLASLAGVSIESLVVGAAIALGFKVSPLLGLAVTFAAVAHGLPRGFSTALLTRGAGHAQKGSLLALAIDGALTPLGAFLAWSLQLPAGGLLAFIAGGFIYMGASDLLPGAHERFNLKVVLLVLLGALVPLSIAWGW
ncbi:MAG: hypothetical protein HY555_03990 [Euryarchaeota archaeon]|nr:hypothetical protein [Euryarchaeota archaeon]